MPPKKTRAYFMISVVAKEFGVHPQTLRLYEREGLLKPSRTEGNTRLFHGARSSSLVCGLSKRFCFMQQCRN